MNVKFILPALTEAKSAYWRPINYSLFLPLWLVQTNDQLGRNPVPSSVSTSHSLSGL